MNPTEYLSIWLLTFFYGALFGSFGNVLILRIPKNEDWIFLPSHCTQCHRNLKWWMNIPLLSFVLLRGKCSYCSKKISYMYPLFELMGGLKALFILSLYNELLGQSIVMFIIYDMILFLLAVHFVIDLKHHILPDVINVALFLLACVLIAINGSWKESLIGGTLGFLAPLLITYLFYQVRGQVGLGGGDIKLFGIIGMFLGFQGVIQTLFFSSFMGIVVALVMTLFKKGNLKQPFAFGPSIIVVFVLQFYFPKIFSLINIFAF